MEDNGRVNINGRMYDWGMVRTTIGGTATQNINAISYKESQEVTAIYGGGRYAVGYGKGRISAEGSVTLKMEEVVALQRSAPGGRLQDIAPFDVAVTYLHPESNKVVTDVLKGCLFTSNGREWSEGDIGKDVELPLMVLKINWGGSK